MELRNFLTDFRDELPEENVPIASHGDIDRVRSMTLRAESGINSTWRVLDRIGVKEPFTWHFKTALSLLANVGYSPSTSQCKDALDLLIRALTSIYVDLSGAAVSSGIVQRTAHEDAPDAQMFHMLKTLNTFACFCDREDREQIECIIGDLKKVIRKMQREKCTEKLIKRVLRWQVAKVITRITWDGFRRFLAAIFPVGTILRKLTGL